MTEKTNPVPLRAPLVLPPNFRDVTAEKVGTVIGIIGATDALRPSTDRDATP